MPKEQKINIYYSENQNFREDITQIVRESVI